MQDRRQESQCERCYYSLPGGCRKGKSTGGLLLLMTETLEKTLDKGWIIGVLLIDFLQVLDSTGHTIMKARLQGFRSSANEQKISVSMCIK